jgi:hypothetical protein
VVDHRVGGDEREPQRLEVRDQLRQQRLPLVERLERGFELHGHDAPQALRCAAEHVPLEALRVHLQEERALGDREGGEEGVQRADLDALFADGRGARVERPQRRQGRAD